MIIGLATGLSSGKNSGSGSGINNSNSNSGAGGVSNLIIGTTNLNIDLIKIGKIVGKSIGRSFEGCKELENVNLAEFETGVKKHLKYKKIPKKLNLNINNR